jgi:hypothetical protein
MQSRWVAQKKGGKCGGYYAVCHAGTDANGKEHKIRMHRAIMGLGEEEDDEVDHIEPLATLGNWRGNLRRCSHQENSFNQQRAVNNTSGFKGVSYVKRDGTWRAGIRVEGKTKTLGDYLTPEAAHEAYKEAATFYFGKFARFK